MNKKQILVVCATMLLSLPQTFSQAIEGGDLETSLNLGFGLYGFGDNQTEDVTSIAVPGLVNLRAEYAVAKWLSLGVMYERNGFLTDPDSTENAQSNNFYLTFRFRIVNTENTVVHTNLDLGSSSYKYEDEFSKLEATSTGSATQIGFGIKHFLSDHIAIGYDFLFAAYAYNEIELDGFGTLTFFDEDDQEEKKLELGMVGINHRVGITYRF